jgi:CheY-like chemotaxis protein
MTVLMLGRNLELALYRAEVLRNAGHTVMIPKNKMEALDSINNSAFDVAIISYTLSSRSVEELAELLRQRAPQTAILSIAAEGWEDRLIEPDETVLANDGPQALVAALQRIEAKRIRRIS